MRRAALACLLFAAAPAHAAERGYSITSFDRIRVEGPYRVELTTGKGSSARATGPTRALDGLTVRIEGRLLIVRRGASSWGGYPGEEEGGVIVRVSTPAITAASLAGSGALLIDAMRGAKLDLAVEGSGRLGLAKVEADRLGLIVGGSGGIVVAGQAKIVKALVRGPGDLDAAALTATDADITAEGAGTIAMAATRTAAVTASGSGSVTIGGAPACTVRNLGSATVACGKAR